MKENYPGTKIRIHVQGCMILCLYVDVTDYAGTVSLIKIHFQDVVNQLCDIFHEQLNCCDFFYEQDRS